MTEPRDDLAEMTELQALMDKWSADVNGQRAAVVIMAAVSIAMLAICEADGVSPPDAFEKLKATLEKLPPPVTVVKASGHA